MNSVLLKLVHDVGVLNLGFLCRIQGPGSPLYTNTAAYELFFRLRLFSFHQMACLFYLQVTHI